MKQYGKHTQFFEASELPKGVVLIPEKRMLAAMLERAYLDYYIYQEAIAKPNLIRQKYDTIEDPRNPKQQLAQLKGWFKSPSKDPFSLNWICEHFDPTWEGLSDSMREAIKKPLIDSVLMEKLRNLKK